MAVILLPSPAAMMNAIVGVYDGSSALAAVFPVRPALNVLPDDDTFPILTVTIQSAAESGVYTDQPRIAGHAEEIDFAFNIFSDRASGPLSTVVIDGVNALRTAYHGTVWNDTTNKIDTTFRRVGGFVMNDDREAWQTVELYRAFCTKYED